MKKHRAHGELRNITNIDVTPLVDLTFLLLIVFMITSPVLERGLDVSPPQLESSVIEDDEHKIINVTQNGVIMLDSRAIPSGALQAELQAMAAANPKARFFIRADETRPYGEVMSVMRAARAAGITNVSLVTLPEDGG